MDKVHQRRIGACRALVRLGISASLSPTSAQQELSLSIDQGRRSVPLGWAVDLVTRLVFNQVSERWNQTLAVENRAGAGGISAPMRWRSPNRMATRSERHSVGIHPRVPLHLGGVRRPELCGRLRIMYGMMQRRADE